MAKKISLFFVIILISLCLNGCFDSREIDDEVYAISIGIDYGIKEKIRLTIQTPIYTEASSNGDMVGTDSVGSKNKQGENIVQSIEAPSILEAVDLFGMSVSRRISLMHAKFLFFSEEIARDGISQYIQAFNRYFETRPSMVVVVVNGRAEDFILKNTSDIGGTISKTMELLFNQSDDFGYFPKAKLHNFEVSRGGYLQPIAIYGGINNFDVLENADKYEDPKKHTGKINVGHKPGQLPRRGPAERELVGTAVFRNDKMVGSLNEYETVYYLLVINKHSSGAYSIIDKMNENSVTTFNLRSNGVKIRVNLDNREKPIIDITINVEADVESIQSGYNYERLEKIENLNNDLRESLVKGIRSVIEKTQKEFKSDIFGIGKKVACKFLTIREWEEYNWIEKFPQAVINVDVKVNIRRTGSLIQSSR